MTTVSHKNADGVRRLIAYIIDIFVVTMICMTIGFFIPSSDKVERLVKEQNELTETFLEKADLSTKEVEKYYKELGKYTYEINKDTYLEKIIVIAVYVGYYIIYQYNAKGRSLGKKVMNIKIDKNGEDPSLKDIILRELFAAFILTMALEIVGVFILSKNSYWTVLFWIETVIMLFFFISFFMVLFRKDKRAIHDLYTNTSVIIEK